MVFLRLLLLLITTYVTEAQTVISDLNQDMVFTAVMNRRLKYPRQAEWSSRYGRVFAEFTVNEKGRIQSISILNHNVEWDYAGLEPTVINALKKLPPLSLQYVGRYILPVSFILIDYRHKDSPLVPTNTLHIEELRDRVILKEIKVTGSTINSRERIKAAEKNESY
ncbi:hypothetical protein [Spirosoma sp. KNUC1025]|uniref:hypothetical protein n=1 Tax=Spirosoma sp. KNUC1025 TaxID=2894082 RepID=UPI00386D23E3|nr:energy transducer TonB [Spirosoma sp. KNUC1025]